MKDDTILDEAKKVIWGDREKTYGQPDLNMRRIAGFWSVILGTDVTVDQAVLCMVAVKLARLVHNPDHRDSQVDLCGYTALLERIYEAENEDPKEKLDRSKAFWGGLVGVQTKTPPTGSHLEELEKLHKEAKEELKQRYPDPEEIDKIKVQQGADGSWLISVSGVHRGQFQDGSVLAVHLGMCMAEIDMLNQRIECLREKKDVGMRYLVEAENKGTKMYVQVNAGGTRGWTDFLNNAIHFENYAAAADEAIIILNKMAFGKYPGFPYGPITVRPISAKKPPETHKDEIS